MRNDMISFDCTAWVIIMFLYVTEIKYVNAGVKIYFFSTLVNMFVMY